MHKNYLEILGICCLFPLVAKADQHEAAHAGAKEKSGTDLFLTADFIYWTARQEGLEYASSGFSAAGNTRHQGKAHRPNFGYHPGFKVGAGLDMEHGGWDVYANYTWLCTGNRRSSAATSGDLYVLWSTFAKSDFGAAVLNGDALWKLNFNVVDLELGRNFYVSQGLALRPNFGLKGSWQQQHFSTHFLNIISGEIRTLKERFRQHYLGIGIRGGVDSCWQFCKNWGIYGDLALSGMWSRFEHTRKDVEKVGSTDLVYMDGKDNFHTITPVLELGLGLKWDYGFSEDNYHLGIQAGWEEQVWWDMNQFFGLHDRGPHGNLVLQGLTLEARFDF